MSFLNERDAFKARGTCYLFWTAYFGQAYELKLYSLQRVLGMLAMGYEYRKLEAIEVKSHMLVDLSPLERLPALKKLILIKCDNRHFETMPASIHLNTL